MVYMFMGWGVGVKLMSVNSVPYDVFVSKSL